MLKAEGRFDFKWLSVTVSSDAKGSQSGTSPHVAFCWLAQRPGEAPGAPQGSDPTGVPVSPGAGSAVVSKGNSGTVNGEALGFLRGAKPWESPSRLQQGSAPTAASPRWSAAGLSTRTGLQKVGLPMGRGGLTPTESNHSS